MLIGPTKLVASATAINEISAERIRDELVRIFLSPNRTRGWDLLDATGLMRAILPELDRMKGVLQPEQFHPEGDVFKHTRLMLQFLPEKVPAGSASRRATSARGPWPHSLAKER